MHVIDSQAVCLIMYSIVLSYHKVSLFLLNVMVNVQRLVSLDLRLFYWWVLIRSDELQLKFTTQSSILFSNFKV